MRKTSDNISIGNGNKISGSIIGSNNTVTEKSSHAPKTIISKFVWRIIVPILVGITVLILYSKLGSQ